MRVTLLSFSIIDFTDYDPVTPGAILNTTAETFEYVNGSGDRVVISGSGFVPGAPPTTGTIDTIVAFASTGVPILAIGEVGPASVLPAGAFDDANLFWNTVLAGETPIDTSGASPDVPFGSILAGDALVYEGGSGAGAIDTVSLGASWSRFFGDVETMGAGNGRDYTGGDDAITAGSNPEGRGRVAGDANRVLEGNRFTGGDDAITSGGGGWLVGDVFQSIFGQGRMVGGDDAINVGGVPTLETRVTGDVAELADLFGALEFVGGDDTITIATGALRATGDADVIDLRNGGSTSVMGDDIMTGGVAADFLVGDIEFFGSTIATQMGDDLIQGGSGNDAIYGDVREVAAPELWNNLRGGDDTLLGGDGDDVLYGGTGNNRIDGGNGFDAVVFEGVDFSTAQFARAGANLVVLRGAEADVLSTVEVIQASDIDPQLDVATIGAGVIDALAYVATYADLIIAYGQMDDVAVQGARHYYEQGRADGRFFEGGAFFDAQAYVDNYADLSAAFGTGATLDVGAASLHFIRSGVFEGRLGQDAIVYLASNPDLIAAFGADEGAAVNHWQSFGRFEGRDLNFDGAQYLSNYADLQAVFGTNVEAATRHFIQNGFGEGRTDIDPFDYIASNPDLIGAFGGLGVAEMIGTGVAHYMFNGRAEGRPADAFDAAQYLKNYADLRDTIGFDLDAAALHYIQTGFGEGRTDDPLIV